MAKQSLRAPRFATVAALITGGLFTIQPAQADAVSDFYAGKTLDMIIGSLVGNDFDLRGRLLSRHMGKYIPGKPEMRARNMPGGGGVIAMNHLATRAPHDGTVLHMTFPNMGTVQATGQVGVQFDMRKFYYIGNTTNSPNILNTWHTSDIRTIDDAKKREVVLGANPGITGIYYARALNEIIGTKFRVVSGYPGGGQINIAMEAGEVEGRASNTWASWKATKPDWVAQKKFHVLFQVGRERHPELKDIPLMTEFASNEADRKLLQFLSDPIAIARAVVTTPDVPMERVTALRRAFDAVMKDPAFIEEANKMGLDLDHMTGEEAQKINDALINSEPDIIARAKRIMDAP